MSLEELMHSIILNHHPDYLRHRLESYDMRLSQRNNEADIYAQIDMKLHQFSVDHSPYCLVNQLCNKDGLIAIMDGQFHEDFPGVVFKNLDMSTLIKYVLDAFKIPLLPRRYKGRERILDELRSCKEHVDRHMRQPVLTQRIGGHELHMRRGLSLSCWTYMEELLKQVLGFYALHFGRFADAIAKELRTAFIKVCRVRGKSLGFILIAFEEIEFIFQHGEGRVQQKYREKLTKEDKSARQQGEEIAYRLREECMDAFGCYSPFSFLKIDEIKTLVKRYRNPYAHVGRPNRLSAVDRFLDSKCQSRFSDVRWRHIFNEKRFIQGC